ncbi:hypothetical protein LIS04_143 [Listeria phage LIS04]|nr:hypothetical protein LIS04_143 [Listeria phage LIS04]
MILAVHSQPSTNYTNGFNLVAGSTLEEVYRSVIQQLRVDGSKDREETTITFSTGLQVVVIRNESLVAQSVSSVIDFEDTSELLDSKLFGEFESEFDYVDPIISSPTEVKFEEISRTKLTAEQLYTIFNIKSYHYQGGN